MAFEPYIQVVVAGADERRVWFLTSQCDPDRGVLEGLDQDLRLRTAGAYSLDLESLDLGMIKLMMNPTFTAEQIGTTPEATIEEIKEILKAAVVSGPIGDAGEEGE